MTDAKNMKLYKVNIQESGKWGFSYVVAKDPTEAYRKYQKFLDTEGICFPAKREMESVELVADSYIYGGCGVLLIVGKGAQS